MHSSFRSPIFSIVCIAAILSSIGCRPVETPEPTASAHLPPATKTLKPLSGEAQLQALIETLRKQTRSRRSVEYKEEAYDAAASADVAGAAPAPLMEAAPPGAASDKPAAEESITNVQTAGVDEGGIVKRRGDYLIVLRRGRLFTVRIGGDDLKPVSMIDAYDPGIDPSNAWYDEMLVSGHTIVVIGYSYERGGTEIGLFDLDDRGGLAYRATYHLRSNDYYSSRNYASRLIGDKLVFYSPMFLDVNGDYADALPALRRWQPGAQPKDFRRILPAEHIYRGQDEPDADGGIALHTVTICDLAAAEMNCESTAVLGHPGQVFYVSEDSAFVWTVPWTWRDGAPKRAEVFRIPLDGSAPTALRARGAPIDQMSFLQKDGYLNVMLSAGGMGQWMWGSESTPTSTEAPTGAPAIAPTGATAASTAGSDFALLRVPLTMFGDGTETTPSSDYRPLRQAGLGGYGLQNRFVGDWLLLGTYSWDERQAPQDLYAIRYASNQDFVAVPMAHPVERIDALGRDGIVIGESEGALHFTSLSLSDTVRLAGRFSLPNASQGDERTHGFFYRATGEQQGIVGLPILGGDGDRQQASVLFLRNRALQLQAAGRLDALSANPADDGCKVSCVDWYGNARPIFIGNRVFALMGYELVEGGYEGEGIRERRRVDFAPGRQVAIAR